MFKTIEISVGHRIRITQNPKDFVTETVIGIGNLVITLDLLNNCLDTIYMLVGTKYPKVYRPKLFISDEIDCNAYAWNRCIIISFSFFKKAGALIQRYTRSLLDRYVILKGESEENVQSGIRVSLWRYVLLHELYHLWHGHSQWKAKYQTTSDGRIVMKLVQTEFPDDLGETTDNDCQYDDVFDEKELCFEMMKGLSKNQIEKNITQQALELDADSSAVCMLINLMMYDMHNRHISKNEEKKYVRTNLAYIMAGISTAFCLFDQNTGANFKILNKLEKTTHPIPAIRLVYAQEIANSCLDNYFRDEMEIREVESEWQKMICDVEADYGGTVDMGQVFYYPAYTEKGQRHLFRIKRRLTDMHESLVPFALGNIAKKLDEEDLEYSNDEVYFDEKGKSLYGWINPATGKNFAVRADKMPVIKGEKLERNDPCPCGSGKKYKQCCGK